MSIRSILGDHKFRNCSRGQIKPLCFCFIMRRAKSDFWPVNHAVTAARKFDLSVVGFEAIAPTENVKKDHTTRKVDTVEHNALLKKLQSRTYTKRREEKTFWKKFKRLLNAYLLTSSKATW